MAPDSLKIELRNNTDAAHLYASITGRDAAGIFLLSADGSTPYRPSSPSSTLQPPEANVGISVGGPGAKKTVTVPRLSGARIWFSKGQPLKFFINPGPALVEPSATNTSDANYGLDWGFAEFTLNDQQLYVNVSYVDFVSLPISLGVVTAGSGQTRTVPGLPSDGLEKVAKAMEKQGGGWEKLVIRSGGKVQRVLSPNAGGVLYPGLFDEYYKPYVNAVWDKYRSEDLTVNTQFTWGDVKGRVNSSGLLSFGGSGSFAKPSAGDIFSCSTGPFAHTPTTTDETLNIGARLAAAFNRSTLLKNKVQPEGEKVSQYYGESVTNHYSRICHEVTVEGRGYAFPYDDVGSSKGEDQSGFLNDGNPSKLILSVGKPL